jgi:flagellar biosynthesis/type III secretory pathway protein FliH
MYVETTEYEEELKLEAKNEGIKEGIEKGKEEGKREERFNSVKVLVSKENWPLSKAAELFGLNETEERQLANELGDIDYIP